MRKILTRIPKYLGLSSFDFLALCFANSNLFKLCTTPMTEMFIHGAFSEFRYPLGRKGGFSSSKCSINGSGGRGCRSLLVGGRDLNERGAQLVRVGLQLLDDR